MIPSAVAAARHHKLAGSSLVCTQLALCRANGGNDSLHAALAAHIVRHGQRCTQVRADVTWQKEEEGRALKWLIVLDSFPIVPHLWHPPRHISLARDRAGHDGSDHPRTAPKPWSIRDKLCHCYSVLLQNLPLPGKWGWDLIGFLEKSFSTHWSLLQERKSGTVHPADPLPEMANVIFQAHACAMLPGQSMPGVQKA